MSRGTRLAAVVLGIVGLVAASPGVIGAQARSGGIKGIIVAIGEGGKRPLAGARITLVGTVHASTTDARGIFHFVDLDPGRYLIHAAAIGYGAMSSPLIVKEQETLDIEFVAQAEAVNLPELTVEEQANHGPADWIRRRGEGRGRYITRRQLEERRSATVPDALRLVAGLRIECRGSVICSVRMARAPRGCSPAFFLDGIPTDPAVVWMTPVAEVEGIEVYSGPAETPPELESAQARCGVIALWTRPPPPRRPKEPKPKASDSTSMKILPPGHRAEGSRSDWLFPTSLF